MRSLLRILILGLAAVSAFIWESRHDIPGDAFEGLSWAWVIGGAAVVCALGALILDVSWGWRLDVRDDREVDAIAELQTTIEDALLPLARSISAMPDMTPTKRLAELKPIAKHCAWALCALIMPDIDRPRAAVYSLATDGSSLSVVDFAGRGNPPGEFRAGFPASNAALERVTAGRSLTVRDWKKDPPEGLTTEPEWRSFVSVPIVAADGYAYGMVVIDSPTPNSFGAPEEEMVRMFAQFLSIAFALAYPRRSVGAPQDNVGTEQ